MADVQTASPASLRKQAIDEAIDSLGRSLTPHQWNSPSDQQATTQRALESLRRVLHRHEEILEALYPEHEPPGELVTGP